MSKFSDLISIPTSRQQDKIFGSSGWGGSEGRLRDIYKTLFSQFDDLEAKKRIQNITTTLLDVSSREERFDFKKMIVDIIKDDLPYIDKLKRELKYTQDNIQKQIIQGKIQIIEGDIDRIEIPTGAKQEISLKKYIPCRLPDRSFVFPIKNELVLFVEKIILQKGFNGGEYGGLFSIDTHTQRQKSNF